MPDHVDTTLTGAVARVTLHRPNLHNAFNDDVIAEISTAFKEAGENNDVRVVVLCSEGKSFCAGADVNWMRRMVEYSFEDNVADALRLSNMLRTIRECPKPVIARVHGTCIGGGVGLAAACDVVASVKSAVFSLSEVKLGIAPAVISPFVTERLGPGAMRRYALTAERFDADEARRIGLVDEVFETVDALDAWIDATCRAILGNGPRAVAACKRILSTVAGADWDHLQTVTARTIAELRASPEGQDGLRAFLEKRKPGWVSD
ncbi:MAG: enoyl-CoA hydratase/isomerase family protein [Phycisphaerales bacterium]|nr:MAG: enoyl-CoA hydratase/isomerase family protein [Phycisphaerales bacterium]